MRIVVWGAGGLGSVVGAYLARGGQEVTLVGRPAHVEAIHRAGLRISGHEDFAVPVGPTLQAIAEASSLVEADLLLLTVKTKDTETALAEAAHLRPGIAASLQNGVQKDEQLIAAFGSRTVLGAATILGATLVAPGHVACTMFGTTWFGELDERRTERLEQVAGAFRAAGLKVDAPPSIRSAEWSKLCQILPAATLSALSRLEYHKVCQSADLAHLFVALTHECAAVAAASNIGLGDYPGFNVKTLAEAPWNEAVDMIQERGRKLEERGMTQVRISMLQDVLAGRQTEIEAIAGDVLRWARQQGVAVPTTEVVCHLIRGIDTSL
jgi:2-dehydropantoate 2-reductase